MIKQYATFGALGLLMESLWTGLDSLIKRDFRLVSRTSLWMFFIYGLACFLGPVSSLISSYPVFFRGVIYAVCIFAVEYVSGYFMMKLNACPWDYSGSRFSVKGIIRLDYAPVWFAVGLVFEFIHRRMFP